MEDESVAGHPGHQAIKTALQAIAREVMVATGASICRNLTHADSCGHARLSFVPYVLLSRVPPDLIAPRSSSCHEQTPISSTRGDTLRE